MSILTPFLRSLLLTSVLSFTAPLILVGAILVSLSLLGFVPLLESVGATGVKQVLQFLATFGSGQPFQGLVIIGFVCGLVGGLFDTFNFYRYQNLRNH
ncbi:hypothetical protein H6F90_22550 [Trichocoleus sp. FACHB-591]|uniref:hypothetical protein n=1 Tax=Trichocoleus sp. FACHB-591 TaxID=2692872 RepID=UPI0016874C4F|nr:hypothetical protein [Trichocoleus sp. FACHB-591]MBD2097858.1 hypothetical protein [Trichocoleus sp. FACHB-591]